MKTGEAKVLLYSFREEEKIARIRHFFAQQQVRTEIVPENASSQKIGYLIGMKGFKRMDKEEEAFVFPHEFLIFHNIKGKKLDHILLEMKKAELPPVRFKAVVTPFNMLWTLRRLCETVQKEHGAMMEIKKRQMDV